jgi:hypothetical protein
MEKQRKAEMMSVLLVAANLADNILRRNFGGDQMNGMLLASASDIGFATIMENIVNVGITPVLLVVFIVFFIRKANDDDARVKKAYEEAQTKIDESNKTVREREDTLMAESAKREEILRQEAEKRESLIRKEAEKRESILMANQDRMLDSMDKITDSLGKIEVSLNKMESRHEQDIAQLKDQMNSLEHKMDHIGGN